jgi:hypothetical protein
MSALRGVYRMSLSTSMASKRWADRVVAGRFLAEARSFFDEVVGGTDKFRQLHSLSEQFPHDYHNRFIVELIQNANDASDADGEVRIVLDERDAGARALYVANRGRPFSRSNFNAIRKLGLSDKDPQKAIGNKGLGFRSVLQVCRSPVIYSDHSVETLRRPGTFSGFCFQFTPDVRGLLVQLADELARNASPHRPSELLRQRFGIAASLMPERARAERLQRILSLRPNWIREQVNVLSPYSMPLPVGRELLPPVVAELKEQGFVTVVQLVLEHNDDREATYEALSDLDATSLIFMERLARLSVEHLGGHDQNSDLGRHYERRGKPSRPDYAPPASLTTVEVVSRTHGLSTQPSDDEVITRTWIVHRGDIAGHELAKAIQELPSRWHSLQHVEVSVALERSAERSQEGRYSIYLPTVQATGSALWVNGPFHGDVARRTIQLGIAYNDLLFRNAVRLALEMLDALLKAGGVEASSAALDLLELRGSESPLLKALDASLAARGTALADLQAVALHALPGHSEPGMGRLGDIREPLMRREWLVFTPDRLALAGARLANRELIAAREATLRVVAKRAGNNLQPTMSELANWAERIASSLLRTNAEDELWNAFYSELAALAEFYGTAFQAELRRSAILLAEDGRILAADDRDTRVFTLPVQSAAYDADQSAGHEQMLQDARARLPQAAQSRMAYLASRIVLQEEKPPRAATPAARLLRGGNSPLVREFDTERVVNEVLVPIVGNTDATENDLAEVLSYAFQLARSARGDPTFERARWTELRVPTDSGWRRGGDAYFSASWPGVQGRKLREALGALGTARLDIILPPSKFTEVLGWPSDDAMVQAWSIFLVRQVQVADTPRLREMKHDPKAADVQQARFRVTGRKTWFRTEELQNLVGMPQELWAAYREYLGGLTPLYKQEEQYHLASQYTLDGLFECDLDRAEAFAELVTASWATWREARTTKLVRSVTPYRGVEAESTLGFALKRLRWLPAVRDVALGKQRFLANANEVWLIPAELLAHPLSRMRYSFLPHLPLEVARVVDEDYRRFIGVRSATELSTFEDAVALLGALARIHETADLAPERQSDLGNLWRETLSRAGELFAEEGENVSLARTAATNHRMNGVRYREAGKSEWTDLPLGTANSDVPVVYLQDARDADPALLERLPVVEASFDSKAGHLRFLEAVFGERVQRLSELHIVPVHDGASLHDVISAAPRLRNSRAAWLEPFVLAVYAFGRGHDMRLEGEEFSRRANRLADLRFAEIDDFSLRVEGLNDVVLRPPSYYWEEEHVLVLERSHAGRLTNLVSGFQALFGVRDLGDALYRAFSSLPEGDLMSAPSIEGTLAALQEVRVRADDFLRVRGAVEGGVESWVAERAFPAVCALNDISEAGDVARVHNRLVDGAATGSLRQVLQNLGHEGLRVPTGLYDLALAVGSDRELAERLAAEFDLTLAAWNRSVAAIGNPYRPLRNDDIDVEFSNWRDELRPAVSAVARESLVRSGRPEDYIRLKQKYADLSAPSEWPYLFWRMPFIAFSQHVKAWLAEELGNDNEAGFHVFEAGSAAEVRVAAADAGLDLKHDDDATEALNRARLAELRDALLVQILAHSNFRDAGNIPPLLVAAQADTFEATETRSVCQVAPLAAAAAGQLVIARFSASGAFEVAGIAVPAEDPATWSTTIPAQESEINLAKELLERLRRANERRGRTQTVVGRGYELPRGDRLEGLRQLLDSALEGAALVAGSSLLERADLGAPPAPTQKGSSGPPGGGRRPIPQVRELTGAIGEYVVFKALAAEIGPQLAAEGWRSKNRRHFLIAAEEGNDDLGYDFEFVRDAVRWMFEVKATDGISNTIELTQKEREVAHAHRTGRRGHYTIVYVGNALTEPTIYTLGNPFSRTGRKQFRIEEGGVRVGFRLID